MRDRLIQPCFRAVVAYGRVNPTTLHADCLILHCLNSCGSCKMCQGNSHWWRPEKGICSTQRRDLRQDPPREELEACRGTAGRHGQVVVSVGMGWGDTGWDGTEAASAFCRQTGIWGCCFIMQTSFTPGHSWAGWWFSGVYFPVSHGHSSILKHYSPMVVWKHACWGLKCSWTASGGSRLTFPDSLGTRNCNTEQSGTWVFLMVRI